MGRRATTFGCTSAPCGASSATRRPRRPSSSPSRAWAAGGSPSVRRLRTRIACMITGAPQRTSAGDVLKRLLVGRPMASHQIEHTLLPKVLALPVFSSDALSSVAYATEEILRVLLGATAAALAFRYVMPIAIAIATLMLIVVASYRQTVRAYPNGGGAYIVSKENLGTLPGLVAAGALLIDYVLTVSVSVVAGVFALTSAVTELLPFRIELSIGFVLLITLANLRGVRESGTLFAFPTYAFIASIITMIGVGLLRCIGGCPSVEPIVPAAGLARVAGPIGLFVILRAFSSGSTALTGVEAISNGVPAFRRPQSKNAAETLAVMGVIAITMFLGISWLATHIENVTVSEERTVIAQIGHTVFGGGFGFYALSFFTASILILAANTAYQDFPRLSAILARDRFMPRQFMNRGDRLVFSNGVIGLAFFASVIMVAFNANLTQLIQLYVVGVFTSFTLSQTGMVRHWLKEKHKGAEAQPGWRRSIVINTIGAMTTGIVLIVITSTKFVHGAWLSILAMAVLVPTFYMIHRHYGEVIAQLRRGKVRAGTIGVNHMVLVIRDLDAAAAEAVGVVRSIRPTELRVVHPCEGEISPELQERWRAFSMGAPRLEPLVLGKDSILDALRRYVRSIERSPDDFVNVVIPEVVSGSMLGYLLRAAGGGAAEGGAAP